jgi:hypothetical protein
MTAVLPSWLRPGQPIASIRVVRAAPCKDVLGLGVRRHDALTTRLYRPGPPAGHHNMRSISVISASVDPGLAAIIHLATRRAPAACKSPPRGRPLTSTLWPRSRLARGQYRFVPPLDNLLPA